MADLTEQLTRFIRDRIVPDRLKDRFDETSPLLEWVYLAPLRHQESVRTDRVQPESAA